MRLGSGLICSLSRTVISIAKKEDEQCDLQHIMELVAHDDQYAEDWMHSITAGCSAAMKVLNDNGVGGESTDLVQVRSLAFLEKREDPNNVKDLLPDQRQLPRPREQ